MYYTENINKAARRIVPLIFGLATFVSSSAYAVSPDDALAGISNCNEWNSKKGEACDFKHGNHDFRIWKPNVSQVGENFSVDIKFDHKLAHRTDDHWYVTIRKVDGNCSSKVKGEKGGNFGGIPGTNNFGRKFDEGGWEHALSQIVDSVGVAYGCILNDE